MVDGLVNASGMQPSMAGMLKSFQADRTKFTDGFVRSMYTSKQTEAYIAHVKEQSLKTPTNTAVVEIYNVQSLSLIHISYSAINSRTKAVTS